MSSVCLSTFGLHEDVPEPAPDPEWRALVRQHAQTLAGMLQRLQTAVAEGQRRPDALRLQALAAAAEQRLTAQARYLSAIRALAQVRRLGVPAVQINVGGQQVNVTG